MVTLACVLVVNDCAPAVVDAGEDGCPVKAFVRPVVPLPPVPLFVLELLVEGLVITLDTPPTVRVLYDSDVPLTLCEWPGSACECAPWLWKWLLL